MNAAAINRTTFAVADVEPATTPRPESAYAEAIAYPLQCSRYTPLESWSQDSKMLLQPNPIHPFMRALNVAFALHHPLVMSPDMIWLLIARGLAMHIGLNAETLRHRFVAHEGKELLVVIRDGFTKGFAGNDWEGVFAEFSAHIKAHVGAQTHRLVVKQFSTTGIVEKAAMEITLMAAMQFYFDYLLVTRCGIPSITLEGAPQDWEQVRDGARQLAQFDLEWWIAPLLPVLEQFVQASSGQVDRDFWNDLYKCKETSGGPYINGHIVNLFPYLSDRSASPFRNPFLGYTGGIGNDPESLWKMDGMTTDQLPGGLAIAPFIWNYLGTLYLVIRVNDRSSSLPFEVGCGYDHISSFHYKRADKQPASALWHLRRYGRRQNSGCPYPTPRTLAGSVGGNSGHGLALPYPPGA